MEEQCMIQMVTQPMFARTWCIKLTTCLSMGPACTMFQGRDDGVWGQIGGFHEFWRQDQGESLAETVDHCSWSLLVENNVGTQRTGFFDKEQKLLCNTWDRLGGEFDRKTWWITCCVAYVYLMREEIQQHALAADISTINLIKCCFD